MVSLDFLGYFREKGVPLKGMMALKVTILFLVRGQLDFVNWHALVMNVLQISSFWFGNEARFATALPTRYFEVRSAVGVNLICIWKLPAPRP